MSVWLQRFTEEALEINMRMGNISLESKTRSLHAEVINIAQYELEINDEIFSKCMYAMHPVAYIDGGFKALSPSEILRVGGVLDIKDIFNCDTIEQGYKTMDAWINLD